MLIYYNILHHMQAIKLNTSLFNEKIVLRPSIDFATMLDLM